MLYSIEGLKTDFEALNMKIAKQGNQEISEGNDHQGMANIIRIILQKP